MTWWWMAVALAAPTWEQTVTQALHRDDTWLAGPGLEEALDTHCDAGVAAACAWRDTEEAVTMPRLSAVASLLARSCDADPVGCLVGGWAAGVDDDGHLSARGSRDPAEALALFQQACDGGSQRGCTALGRAHRIGVGTYASQEAATKHLVASCRQGEPRACREMSELSRDREGWLRAAEELGDPVAAWLLSSRTRADDEAACDAGVVEACDALAQAHADAPLPWLASACERGHVPSCARSIVARGDDDAADALHQLAEDWAPADAWAALARHAPERIALWSGGQPLTKSERRSFPNKLRLALWPCYQDAVARGAGEGWVDAQVQIEQDGSISAAALRADWVTEELAACAFDAARDTPPLPEGSGPRIMSFPVSFAHEAELVTRNIADLAVKDFSKAMRSVPSWAVPIDDCAEGLGEVVPARPMAKVRLRADGRVKSVKLVDATGSPALNECLENTIKGLTTEPLTNGVAFHLALQLVQPAEREPEVEVTYRDQRGRHTGPTQVERVLVLVLEGNEVDGKRARLGTKSVDSLRTAYDGAKGWLDEHSGGAVTIEVEVREVDVTLAQGVGTSDRTHRWHVAREDLPAELVRTIEPAHWDVIHLWAPLPRGAPQASLGVVWNDRTLRGAGFVTAALASGRELVLGDQPTYFAVLQGLYSLWGDRAAAHLGAELPPNDRVLRLEDGTRHDPRPHTDEPLAFYEHVFHYELPPSFWRDLATWGDEVNVPQPGNLAYAADPIASEGVKLTDYVNDAIVDEGRRWDAAWDDSDGGESWFGVAFPEPTQVGAVRALLRTGDGEPPTVAVQIRQGQKWVLVGAPELGADGTVELAFSPEVVDAVRLVVTQPEERAVVELEVYEADLPPKR